MFRPLSLLLVVLANSATADFPTPRNTEPLAETADGQPGQQPMNPAAAAAAFKLPDDLTTTLIAAEPDVQNPIAMAWDMAGRMYVAENYTYAQRPIRFEPDLRDRVVVFSGVETNRPVRTIFIDTVTHLTGVETGYDAASGRRGVWLMCPPQLLFVPDDDANLVPDGPPEVVLDGFTVADANHHNFANGIRFAPDGWLYGRCGGSCPGRVGSPGTTDEMRVPLEGGIWRYSPAEKLFEVICHGTTNPWGHDFNEVGELFFINTVNGHLWHGIEGAHFKRPFTLDPNPNAYELIDQHADHYHFDTTGAWHESRDGVANDFGGGHAHSGLLIYQSDTLPPSYRGDVYTLNFHGRRINREILEERGSGYVAHHGEDLFLSADPWFRGIDLQTGPDGRIYVIDWSDTGECHEHTGVHRTSGRIYAIGPADESRLPTQKLDRRLKMLTSGDAASLGELITGRERWFSDRAIMRLQHRQRSGDELGGGSMDWLDNDQMWSDSDASAQSHRRMLASNAVLSHTMILREMFGDKDIQLTDSQREPMKELIRQMLAVRPIDHCLGHHPEAVDTGPGVSAESASMNVNAKARRGTASGLQRIPQAGRYEVAKVLCRVAEDADDHNLPLLVWYGLMNAPDSDAMQMRLVLGQSRWPTLNRQIGRWLGERIQTETAAVEAIGLATRQLLSARPSDHLTAHATLVGLARGAVGAVRPARTADLAGLITAVAEAPPEVRAAVGQLQKLFAGDVDAEQLIDQIQNGSDEPLMMLAAARSLIFQREELGIPPDRIIELVTPLLKDSRINAEVATAFADLGTAEVAELILKHHNNYRRPRLPEVISALCVRPSTATAMMRWMQSRSESEPDLAKTLLSAGDVRTLGALQIDEVDRAVAKLWGTLRETPQAKVTEINRVKAVLPSLLGTADRAAGRAAFVKNCQQCHQLFDQGGGVGPNLTGAQRTNLDYWLPNIIDPSAEVSAAYRATQILTEDGRVLVGLVTDRSRLAVTLVAADRTWQIAVDEIEVEKTLDQSPMPDGLLTPMTDEQIADLVSYLMSPTQVPLPGE